MSLPIPCKVVVVGNSMGKVSTWLTGLKLSFSIASISRTASSCIEAMKRTTLLHKIAEPEEMAASVCAIADPKLFGYCTGQVFAINAGMYLD